MGLINKIGFKQARWEHYFVAYWHFNLLEIRGLLENFVVYLEIYFSLVSSIRPILWSRPICPFSSNRISDAQTYLEQSSKNGRHKLTLQTFGICNENLISTNENSESDHRVPLLGE
jgi:hypothetical protein